MGQGGQEWQSFDWSQELSEGWLKRMGYLRGFDGLQRSSWLGVQGGPRGVLSWFDVYANS
jgi:hypothetical protein